MRSQRPTMCRIFLTWLKTQQGEDQTIWWRMDAYRCLEVLQLWSSRGSRPGFKKLLSIKIELICNWWGNKNYSKIMLSIWKTSSIVHRIYSNIIILQRQQAMKIIAKYLMEIHFNPQRKKNWWLFQHIHRVSWKCKIKKQETIWEICLSFKFEWTKQRKNTIILKKAELALKTWNYTKAKYWKINCSYSRNYNFTKINSFRS